MPDKLDQLRTKLFAAPHGGVACDAVNAIAKHAKGGSQKAKAILAEYVRTGPIGHMREHACARLADTVSPADTDLVEVFRNGLFDPVVRYWSIRGYINSAGQAAFGELVRVAEDSNVGINERAHAIKCLSEFSGQSFDRDLPSDPGFWKQSDLRIAEVLAWQVAGYRAGTGYVEPPRHPALDKPRSKLEKLASRLDRKLETKRRENQDLAEPTNWLTVGDAADLDRICARWDLPARYLDFLRRFSPLRVLIDQPEFYNPFQLFGASELIAAQEGYSFNPIDRNPIEDWPAQLVVIASHGGDPFALDLSKSDGEDAPVDSAEHGTGAWDFSRVADSFQEFLEILVR